jgi:hypothetical protein
MQLQCLWECHQWNHQFRCNHRGIAKLVNQVKQNGYKMVFVMYPQILTDAEYGFNQCGEEFSEAELWIKLVGCKHYDFWFVSALDVVPTDDKSYFDEDLVHPSTKSTEAIGQYVAETIQSN